MFKERGAEYAVVAASAGVAARHVAHGLSNGYVTATQGDDISNLDGYVTAVVQRADSAQRSS